MVILPNECVLYSNSIKLVKNVRCEHEIVFVLARNVASAPNLCNALTRKILPTFGIVSYLINRMLLECSQLCQGIFN